MDIQAVESKLNDVTVTAIPMSSVGSKSYNHQNQKSSSAHNYSTSKSQKNQSQQQYLNYQQNKLVQSAIQLIQQQQYQQQRQQLLENGVSINSTSQSAANHAPSHSGAAASASHSYANYGQNSSMTNGAQLASVIVPQSLAQNSGLSKYAQLLAVIEEMGRDIRPTYAMGRGDRLKRLIIQAKVLVRECLMETERSARQ